MKRDFDKQRKLVMALFGGWFVYEILEFLTELKTWVYESAKKSAAKRKKDN